MTSVELKSLRKKHGLSVTKASRLVHVSDRTWQRYEANQLCIPEAIVDLFKIKVKASDARL